MYKYLKRLEKVFSFNLNRKIRICTKNKNKLKNNGFSRKKRHKKISKNKKL